MSWNLYLNSFDRINSASSPSNSMFKIDDLLAQNIQTFKIKFVDCQIPNIVYPLSTERENNKFYFQEDNDTGTTYSFTLTSKNYTGTTLATELTTQMNNETGNAYTYTCAYDSYTKKLTITEAGNNPFRIIDGTNSCYREIGMDLLDTAFKSSAFELAYPVDISGSKFVDLCSNTFRNPSLTSSGKYCILARIPLSGSFGEIVYHSSNGTDQVDLMTDISNLIEISLRDDRGHAWSLPMNGEMALTLNFQS